MSLSKQAHVADDVQPREEQSFSQRYYRRQAGGQMSMNLTPMIDVVFLLLFFFLMVSRFGAEGMLAARLPARAGVSTDVPRTPLQIRFTSAESDVIAVTVEPFHPDPLPIAGLSEALVTIIDTRPGFDARTPVHLLATDEILWDHVVNAYNAAYAAGFQDIRFVEPQP